MKKEIVFYMYYQRLIDVLNDLDSLDMVCLCPSWYRVSSLDSDVKSLLRKLLYHRVPVNLIDDDSNV